MTRGTRLHITFSPSGSGSLRQALHAARRREKVIALMDNLAIGPINPPDAEARLQSRVRELGERVDDWDWLGADTEAFWEAALALGVPRTVWMSPNDVQEYAGFLEFVRRAGDAAFAVVDLTDLDVTALTRDGARQRFRAQGVVDAPHDLIASEALWDRAKTLSVPDRAAHLAVWKALRDENAPLRLMGPEGLVSAPLSVFDDALLSCATDTWIPAIRVVGRFMTSPAGERTQGSQVSLLESRLLALRQSGRLEIRVPVSDGPIKVWNTRPEGPLSVIDNPEVRLRRP